MIFTANQAGQLLYANDWVSTFTGRSIQHLNQTKWTSVIHPDDYANFWALWNRQTAHELSVQCECRLREEASQTYRWHLLSAQPVNSEAGKVTAWTGFVVNIDAQKIVGQTLQENEELTQAKAKLEQSQRELESTILELNQSNAKLSQFAYIASHDLQEPLRKIQQFGDLLKSRTTSLSDEELVYLDRMQAAAGRMSALIKDLLLFSRLSTRPQVPVQTPLSQIVAYVKENLSVAIDETQAVIEVGDLPTIEGDASQLVQLFQNLLSNALKFRRDDVVPTIRIRARQLPLADLPTTIKPTRSAAVYHQIDITDNGIGFDEKYLDRIFQLFQRLHPKRSYAGTGVGLAICQKVVDNLGGAITASSQVDQGATFSVYLPALTS
jgi:PAS domain S-box-containing protein